jgi:sulfur carrier protein
LNNVDIVQCCFINVITQRIYLPMQLTINGKPRSFEQAALSVADLVTELSLAGKRLAIEHNGEIVPRSQFAQTPLNDGDQLEIVGAVGGG